MRDVTYRKLSKLVVVAAVLGLTACSMAVPSNVSENKARVYTDSYVMEASAGTLGDKELGLLANDFNYYGSGVPEVTVAYDPASKSNTAMRAGNELGRIVGALKNAGIPDVDAAIMPVKNVGDETLVQIAYARSEAAVPKDCKMMPGMGEGSDPTEVADYKFGCSVETQMAKQIARPKDLQGRDGYSGLKDGMRNTNLVWPYKSGEALGDIGGESTE